MTIMELHASSTTSFVPAIPPFAIPFESIDPVHTPQGHWIRPLIDGRRDGGNLPGFDFAVGGLDVPEGKIANTHWHPETDVAVLVWDCGEEGALTLFGDNLQYAVVQHRGEWVPIQKGWFHTVVNLSLTTPVRAHEVRGNETVLADNPLLPHLQPRAEEIGLGALVDLHGVEAVERLIAKQLGAKPAAAGVLTGTR